MALLEIKNLHARIGDTEILHGIDLTIDPGEVHAIMGAKRLWQIDAILCFVWARRL